MYAENVMVALLIQPSSPTDGPDELVEPQYLGYARTAGSITFDKHNDVVFAHPIVFPSIPRDPKQLPWLRWPRLRRLLHLNRGFPKYLETIVGIAILTADQSGVLYSYSLENPVSISAWQSPPIIPVHTAHTTPLSWF